MSRVSSFVLGCVALCALAPASFGQIIYEPVSYQYRVGDSVFYYGGDNPRLLHWAARQQLIVDRFGAVGRGAFGQGWSFEQFNPPEPVYTDLMPYQDVALLGATPAYARNEAMRNVPRYFRKIDLLREAAPRSDGSMSVPATAPQVQRVVPRTRIIVPSGTTTRPVTGRILIIPKKKPADTTDKLVAAAS